MALPYSLRPYQIEGSRAAIKGLTQYAKPFILVAATGAGKSIIIADVCHEIDEPVLILQPNKEILEQNYAKLAGYGVTDIAMYSASVGTKEIAKYTYATIGSIYKTPELFKDFKYIIVDECHQVDPKNMNGMYRKFFEALGTTRIMGLTATPYRIVNKFFTDEYGQLWYKGALRMINRIPPFFFKKIVFQIETRELIEQGYLSPVDYYASAVDMEGLVPNKGETDFTPDSLDLWGGRRIDQIVKALEYADAHHERSLTFCSSLDQAYQAVMKSSLNNVAMVDGKTPKRDREALLEAYRTGELKHMLNVGVLTTGFDMPSLDCVILARPTMSLALYYQMVGRGIRLDPDRPDKRLSVYDLAGVTNAMGKVEDIRIKTEKGGFRDEVWGSNDRLDETELFSFYVKDAKFYKAAKS